MKKGISLVSLVIVIIIMGILASVVVISGLDSTEGITINMFALEILDIQNAVDEYYNRYDKYPSSSDYTLDTTTLASSLQFSEETITDNTINFKVVDLSLIGIKDTEFGSGEGTDVYVLSETTGIVYYLAGVTYENNVYYTLTDHLYDILEINKSSLVSTNDIKVYDVIFTPSTTEYTNQPVKVTVKIPKAATINNITTTNEKSISEETVEGLYKKIQINETSTDKTGNYKVTVNYTNNGVEKTSEYEVANYDANLPSITYTETINGDLKTVNVTINNNGSVIKRVKYEQEIVSDITYFENYGNKLINNQFVIDKDEYFTIYVETESGTKVMANGLPEDLIANVIDVVDGVPIPKGFVASSVMGENTKDGGLVIYEGTLAVTDANVEDAKRERNQYVWVPVDDFSKFVRQDFGNNDVILPNTLGDGFWEVVLDLTTNMPLSTQSTSYVTSTTLAEVQAMYESVKEYKGFYIARYEAGLDIGSHKTSNDGVIIKSIHSKMNKAPYNYVRWTYNSKTNEDTNGAVEVARSVYPQTNSNYGVVSTLTYGVQWDRTLNWWVETKAQNGTKDVTISSNEQINDSTNYGIYSNNEIEKDSFNTGAKYLLYSNYTIATTYKDITTTKSSSADWLLTTGATEKTRVNNIYDMAGNLWEWTMEGYYSNDRALRGGNFYLGGYECPVSDRSNSDPDGAGEIHGFRVALYIK